MAMENHQGTMKPQISIEGTTFPSSCGVLYCHVKAADSVAVGIPHATSSLQHCSPSPSSGGHRARKILSTSALCLRQTRITNHFYVVYFKQRVSLCRFPHGTEQNLTKHLVQVYAA